MDCFKFWLQALCFSHSLFVSSSSYCPPLVAPKEADIFCKLPDESDFSICSSSWLPQGAIAHYKCTESETGEDVDGYIKCANAEENSFAKMKRWNTSQLPCGIKHDVNVPEIHIFGYKPNRKFAIPSMYREKYNNLKKLAKTVIENENATIQDYKLVGLELHNEFRSWHGSPALKLKDELSILAQNWTDHLSSVNHVDMSKSNEYGQNLFVSDSPDKIEAVSDAVQNWYYEGLHNYDWEDLKSNWQNNLALNFAQVVWKSTEFLGFGVSNWGSGRNGTVVLAYYYPTGNVVAEHEDRQEMYFSDNVKPSLHQNNNGYI